MATNREIPLRKDIDPKDTWDLSKLYKDEAAWEAGLKEYEALLGQIAAFKGTLAGGREVLLAAMAFKKRYEMLDERLGYYASLRSSEDEGDTDSRGRMSRYSMAATQGAGAWSWLVPEIQRLPEALLKEAFADARFDEYVVYLKKILRFKPHVLSEAEERVLALQAELNQTPEDTFSVLTNVDFEFGMVDTAEGPRPLSQSAFSSFMQKPDRELRRRAYLQFYSVYDKHKNAIASLYAGVCKIDKYRATIRRYASSRECALFPDDVPVSVYDNLVSTVNANLGLLHEYYGLRKAVLGVDELRHYDVYVPLVSEASSNRPYDKAVDTIVEALAPLGKEYTKTIGAGLRSRWVDRYENKGKRAGAFSAGSFQGDPYIHLNYKEDVSRDMFTVAHEGGHSMHSWYSARSNPFMHYGYTIFEAEVASTFNEQLLFRHMVSRVKTDAEKAYLINSKIDDIVATLFRQTMFAEYESRAHAMLEAGQPLTVDALRAEYRKLLERYFGPSMHLEEVSDLECFRIPHFFYTPFYVYKYATGLSASIALSRRVLEGGDKEREDYLAFLRSGGSRFPIESLKLAGVDMSSPAPIQAACDEFKRLLAELKGLVKA